MDSHGTEPTCDRGTPGIAPLLVPGVSLIRPADFVTHTPTHPGGSMRIVSDDQIWDRIRSEALADAAAEPALAGFLNTVVLLSLIHI